DAGASVSTAAVAAANKAGAGSDFLSGLTQMPSMTINPSFSNVYTPTQTATGGSISIGVPTTGTYAPSGTTATNGGMNTQAIVIMIVIILVLMFAMYMFMKRK
ncbi:MAG: hypothetical protein PHQ43_09720, partial [Dehalococcoidales bacterium]|nr:hypothetical protein [Dehalococcoidales bacterium]